MESTGIGRSVNQNPAASEKPRLPEFFSYVRGALQIDKTSARKLAETHGTPLYAYSGRQIERNAQTLKKLIEPLGAEPYYAVKANPRLGILKIVKNLSLGAEAVSLGEIKIALKAGFPPQKILFNGNGKTIGDVAGALKLGIKIFNFDSLDQLELLEAAGKKQKTKCRALIRIKPENDSATHPYLAVGKKGSKFGVTLPEISGAMNRLPSLKYVELAGIHTHFGSQILDAETFLEVARFSANVVKQLMALGVKLEIINLGGGFGIPYREEQQPLELETLRRGYGEIFRELRAALPAGCPVPSILLEPGRFLVANAGVILSRVVSIKKDAGRAFCVIDAGMTENLRPALYQARHRAIPVDWSKPTDIFQVVGPVCENADILGEFTLPPVKVGDLMAILDCGAYTSVMATTYNGRLRPAEVLVNGAKANLIRRRDRYEDLWQNET
ncbi:MAG: diaminopimelate decarboxylase [Elusimicrobia bacterium]|nr:diaminopimelate decarboxylase [Elusimicrobiota bacterium]